MCRYNTEPRPLQFQHMLSVMSVHKILQPDLIYFHTNIPPIGPYWQRVLKLPRLTVELSQLFRIRIHCLFVVVRRFRRRRCTDVVVCCTVISGHERDCGDRSPKHRFCRSEDRQVQLE